jgi:GNAT superfamily N-acetyltransferase
VVADSRPQRFTLRPARAADRDAIWRVHDDALRARAHADYDDDAVRGWTFAGRDMTRARLDELMAAGEWLVAADEDDAVVGYGSLDLEGAELTMLFVDPAWMGVGVGGAILSALEARARAAGVTELSLWSSLNAVEFYQRRGWRKGAPAEHTLGGASVTCVCMLRDLL